MAMLIFNKSDHKRVGVYIGGSLSWVIQPLQITVLRDFTPKNARKYISLKSLDGGKISVTVTFD